MQNKGRKIALFITLGAVGQIVFLILVYFISLLVFYCVRSSNLPETNLFIIQGGISGINEKIEYNDTTYEYRKTNWSFDIDLMKKIGTTRSTYISDPKNSDVYIDPENNSLPILFIYPCGHDTWLGKSSGYPSLTGSAYNRVVMSPKEADGEYDVWDGSDFNLITDIVDYSTFVPGQNNVFQPVHYAGMIEIFSSEYEYMYQRCRLYQYREEYYLGFYNDEGVQNYYLIVNEQMIKAIEKYMIWW